MDFATILGLILAWGALIGSVVLQGGSVSTLLNAPAALLVIGGTLGAATMSFRMNQIATLPSALAEAFTERTHDLGDVIERLVELADRGRREGLLVLEPEVRELDDPFLRRGLQLVVDGADPGLLTEMLTTEIALCVARRRIGESIFTTLGGFAPTLGIIGTVMGLIHMLANLSDPARLGAMIATAFSATLYGVSSANLIFLPIANKLKARAGEEALVREVMLEGILALQAGDNPRRMEEKLNAYVAPRLRAMPSTAHALPMPVPNQ